MQFSAVCVCCGTYGRAERHHVGGRKHSTVVTTVCVRCHRVLTAWESERNWHSDRPTYRVAVGLLDVLRLTTVRAECGEFAEHVTDTLDWFMRRSGVMTVRPASYLIDVPDIAADDMQDRNWFTAVSQLLRDAAHAVLADQVDGSELADMLRAVDNLNDDRAYREMSSIDLYRDLVGQVAQLATLIRHAELAASRHVLDAGTRAELLHNSTSTIRYVFATMARVKD